MTTNMKSKFFILFAKAFFLFCFACLFTPVHLYAWVGNKDIKNIRDDIAILYEKLESLQRKVNADNEVLLRNQASENSGMESVLDDAQHIMEKLDELTQFYGLKMGKNAREITLIREKFDVYSERSSALLQEIKEHTSISLVQVEEERHTRIDSLDKKIDNLLEILNVFLETEKSEREMMAAEMRGTSSKVQDLVEINREAVQELFKKPEKQAGKVYGELASIRRKILDLAGILKSSILENSKSMKSYTKSLQNLMKSIDSRLTGLSKKKL